MLRKCHTETKTFYIFYKVQSTILIFTVKLAPKQHQQSSITIYWSVDTSFRGKVTQFKVTEIFYVHKSEIQLNVEDFMLPEIYTPENCFTCHQY